MKRFLLLTVLVLLPVLACSHTVSLDPVDIEWDGTASNHQVAVQDGLKEIIILGETDVLEYHIDLQSLGHYGSFVILVRSFEEEGEYRDYSEWIRSDIDEDVITIDGVAQTIVLISIKPAAKPTMIRIKVGE